MKRRELPITCRKRGTVRGALVQPYPPQPAEGQLRLHLQEVTSRFCMSKSKSSALLAVFAHANQEFRAADLLQPLLLAGGEGQQNTGTEGSDGISAIEARSLGKE